MKKTTLTLDKEQIIVIAESMGFFLDYDQFEVPGKDWMRFELKKNELDEQDLRWIWYKNSPLRINLGNAASILFLAGQKAFKQKFEQFEQLEN